jgi:hypothetical protein
MANEKYISVLFPVGRLIQGSLYEPNTKDLEGNLLTVKNPKSPLFGQPRVDFYLGVAIPKTPGVTHWSQEVSPNPRIGAWGKKIWDAGHSFWGELASADDFSWKVTDGDSTKFDKSTPPKRTCDKPNHKGHWIVSFGGAQAPKIVNSDGSAYILEKDAVKRGYFIQVNANLTTNGSNVNRGIKMYHNAVSFQYPGEEITTGIDPASLGFGDGSAPVAAAPFPQFAPHVVAIPPTPPAPPIVPNHGFVNESPTRLLKNGATYDSHIAVGWTEASLTAAGLL